jgi:hypothetical protein
MKNMVPPHYDAMLAQYRAKQNPIVITEKQRVEIEEWAKLMKVDAKKLDTFLHVPVSVRS